MSVDGTEFFVRRLTINDKKNVEDLLRLFVLEEPLAKHLQLTKLEREIFIKPYAEICLAQGVSVGVFEKISGKLCACSVNSLMHPIESSDYAIKGNGMTDNLQKIIRFDEIIEEGMTAVSNNKNVLILELGVVLPGYQNKGMTTKLYAGSEELAIKHNCDTMVITGTSNFAQKSLQRYGFIPIKEILYKDYRDPVTGEAVFAGIPPPHTGAVIFDKKIEIEKSKI